MKNTRLRNCCKQEIEGMTTKYNLASWHGFWKEMALMEGVVKYK